MIPIEIYAWILLVSRIVMVAEMTYVLCHQIRGFAFAATGRLKFLRWSLFAASLALLAGSIYPIIFDVVTIFGDTSRNEMVTIESFIYMMNANLTWLIACTAWFLTYLFANNPEEAVVSTERRR